MNAYEKSRTILDKLRLENGMYLAAGSSDYHYVWLRDTFYEVRPLLHTDSNQYCQTYYSILDMLKAYAWKIEHHTKIRAVEPWQYIHARWDAQNLCEIDAPWGHAQHDAVGAILFGIAEGVEAGLPIIRDQQDLTIIQLVVDYLGCCEYWDDKDNGMWEENREVHSSSVGAVVAGLLKVQEMNLAVVKPEFIIKGQEALARLLPCESETKPADLAQLSLIYPYKVVDEAMARTIIKRVEALLLRERGVLRYEGDSYYSTDPEQSRDKPMTHYLGREAEWTFGLPWLSICHLLTGKMDTAADYLLKTEAVMLADGSLPELYFSNTDRPGPNTPLGWSSAMYIMAVDELALSIKKKQEEFSAIA